MSEFETFQGGPPGAPSQPPEMVMDLVTVMTAGPWPVQVPPFT